MLFMNRGGGLFFITSAPQGFFFMFFMTFAPRVLVSDFQLLFLFLRGGRNTKIVPHKHHKLADMCYGGFLLLHAL